MFLQMIEIKVLGIWNLLLDYLKHILLYINYVQLINQEQQNGINRNGSL